VSAIKLSCSMRAPAKIAEFPDVIVQILGKHNKEIGDFCRY